jgi:uncharacterized protein YyaL (SSP411 family)
MNRLAQETSPYLLQHAGNPVDWQPWDAEALEQARRENKPILLSIGYSACHWCHVMAHESFADADTAAVMNRLFVNIKVDREERPDLDRIYQLAHQLIARRPGGWPLTMFLEPASQVPFFGGTYFPPEARQGMPGFRDLLERVAAFHATEADPLRASVEGMRAAFAHLEPVPPAGQPALDQGPLCRSREILGEQADREAGGFGDAPKFPHPALLDRLLRHWRAGARGDEPDRDALLLVALALKAMADGGIYDQLGGGFCRYSVDRWWSIPHFEKMLHDNGPLLALYAQMFQVSGDEQFRSVARETAGWALRVMSLPGGGFSAALDADSGGAEGRYYLWTPAAARALLDEDEWAVLAPYYGLDREPNFHDPHDGTRAWHLRVSDSAEALAERLALPLSTVRHRLMLGRAKLLRARQQRIRPGRDDKLLTGWNALMIRGLAIAAPLLGDRLLVDAAAGAVDFIRTRMVVDGRLQASFRAGRARFPAYLDDHALLLDALLELLQQRWNPEHLAFATWLAEELLARFEDREQGGFWFTAHDHERLLHRSKPLADEATPSGNGVAALALGRLGHLLGEPRYLAAAERTLQLAWPALNELPHAHPSLLNALAEWLAPPRIVIIRGPGDEPAAWAATAVAAFDPSRLVYVIPDEAGELPGALAARQASGSTVAWVCTGTRCGLPATSLAGLMAQLDSAPQC